MRRLRFVLQHPGLCACAAFNVAALFALTAGVGEFVRDLAGLTGADSPMVSVEVTSPEGLRRWRFSGPEFEGVRDLPLRADITTAAVGSDEAIVSAGASEPAYTRACYLSSRLHERVFAGRAAAGLQPIQPMQPMQPIRGASDATPSVLVTELLARQLSAGPPVQPGAVVAVNGRDAIVAGVTRQGDLAHVGCSAGVVAALEDLSYFSPRARELSAPGTQWLSIWMMSPTGQRVVAWDAARRALESGLALHGGDRLSLVSGLRASMGRSRQILFIVLLLGSAVAVFSILAAVNCYLLMSSILGAREREVAITVALGSGMTRLLLSHLSLLMPLVAAGLCVGLGVSTLPIVRGGVLFNPAMQLGLSGTVRPLTAGVVGIGVCLLVAVSSLLAVRRQLSLGTLIVRLNKIAPESRKNPRQRLLMVAELAVCATAITATLAITLSMRALFGRSPNFDVAGVVLIEPVARPGLAIDPQRIQSRLDALSVSHQASHLRVSPFSGTMNFVPIRAEGKGATAQFNEVGHGIVRALGVTLHAGRDFEPHDEVEERRVTLISRSAAMTLFGTLSVLGRTIRVDDAAHEIVGVFEDPKFNTLREGDTLHAWVPRRLTGQQTIVARTGGPQRDALLKHLHGFADEYRIRTMSQVLQEWQAPALSLRTCLLIACGLVLVSALITVFACASEEIRRQQRVAALLAALGARAYDIALFIGVRIYKDIVIGVAGGVAIGYTILQFLPALTFGVERFAWIAAAVCALVVIGFAVTLVPRLIGATRPNYSLLSDLR